MAKIGGQQIFFSRSWFYFSLESMPQFPIVGRRSVIWMGQNSDGTNSLPRGST